MNQPLHIVILAAGQGSRMKSSLPKVLHPLAGRPLLHHVINTAETLGADGIHVVIGHGADAVKAATPNDSIQWALQSEQLGTGHAVAQALPQVPDDAKVLVLYGDVPLISMTTLERLLSGLSDESLALLTVRLGDPSGYGRILRNAEGKVTAIVEQKDASEEQQQIDEVNTGILAVMASHLKQWLPRLSNSNAQGEYYLTDVIAMAARGGMAIEVAQPPCEEEVEGVNNRVQLATLERWYQHRQAERLMLEGATLADPSRVDIRGEVEIGRDLFIDINVVLEGRVRIGDGVRIGPNCVIRDTELEAGCEVLANSVIEEAHIGKNAHVGPFARIRPGTRLAEGSKIGNFVEVKKAIIGEGSKVNHLSYIGDAEIGRHVNVGAGTITCNYDGVNKFRTVMEDGAFIGSNSALVAPVTIGQDATIGAGSTITRDVAAGELAVARGKQRNIDGWERPSKKS